MKTIDTANTTLNSTPSPNVNQNRNIKKVARKDGDKIRSDKTKDKIYTCSKYIFVSCICNFQFIFSFLVFCKLIKYSIYAGT